MLPLNSINKLPSNLKWYVLTKLLLILLLVSLLFLSSNNWISITWSLFVLFVLPIWIYNVLTFKFTSYTITENLITINSGIFFKRSLTIPFDNIQNSDCSRGPLSTLFDLSKIKIWTASPSQVHIQKGNSINVPEGELWVGTSTANAIKDYILSKK